MTDEPIKKKTSKEKMKRLSSDEKKHVSLSMGVHGSKVEERLKIEREKRCEVNIPTKIRKTYHLLTKLYVILPRGRDKAPKHLGRRTLAEFTKKPN